MVQSSLCLLLPRGGNGLLRSKGGESGVSSELQKSVQFWVSSTDLGVDTLHRGVCEGQLNPQAFAPHSHLLDLTLVIPFLWATTCQSGSSNPLILLTLGVLVVAKNRQHFPPPNHRSHSRGVVLRLGHLRWVLLGGCASDRWQR